MTVVSAPPGSGKTVLLRSWISQASAASGAAWVPVGRGEHDPQQFSLLVLAALRQTSRGAVLVQPLAAAPDLDGWAKPRTQANYIPTLLRRARSWFRSAALQPMRIGSKNGREAGDDDLRGA